MPDNTPKKKSTAKVESKPLRIADYNEYLSRKGAFDDSTSTYNDSIRNHGKLLGIGMTKTNSKKPTKDEISEMLYEGGNQNTFSHKYTNVNTNEDITKKAKLFQKTSSKIAPIKTNTYTGKTKIDQDGVGYQQEIALPIYKKPTQRVVYDNVIEKVSVKPEIKNQIIEEKLKAVNTQKSQGYEKVASSDPKYKNQREYSTYVKKDGSTKEDPFKKATLEARKKILQKNFTSKK